VAENSGGKQRGRPFQPGQSGNPAGKPKGARHKATLLAQALLEGEAEALARKAVDLALAGDTVALRLCLERLVPPIKERAVNAALPRILVPGDVVKAMAALLAQVAKGKLTPSEGQELARIIEAAGKSIEREQLEQRIAALEAVVKERRT
jgi:hypothetical protein